MGLSMYWRGHEEEEHDGDDDVGRDRGGGAGGGPGAGEHVSGNRVIRRCHPHRNRDSQYHVFLGS